MFIYDFIRIERPAAQVQRSLVEGGTALLAEQAGAATTSGEQIYRSVGPRGWRHGVIKRGQVTLEHPYARGDAVVFPIHWQAGGVPWLFPHLDADLEVAPFGDGASQMSLSGRYHPPLSALGGAVDVVLLHRIAQASVRTFLELIAGAATSAPDQSAASGISQVSTVPAERSRGAILKAPPSS